jgi:hypothetical protein
MAVCLPSLVVASSKSTRVTRSKFPVTRPSPTLPRQDLRAPGDESVNHHPSHLPAAATGPWPHLTVRVRRGRGCDIWRAVTARAAWPHVCDVRARVRLDGVEPTSKSTSSRLMNARISAGLEPVSAAEPTTEIDLILTAQLKGIVRMSCSSASLSRYCSSLRRLHLPQSIGDSARSADFLSWRAPQWGARTAVNSRLGGARRHHRTSPSLSSQPVQPRPWTH